MIISLRCQNFRCFSDTGTLVLAPITLLVGENNSGKSSILQALHLPALTLQSEDPVICLKLLHPYYDYGAFEDLVFQHDEKELITLSFGTIVNIMIPREKPKKVPATLQLTYGYMPKRKEIYLDRFVIKDSYGERLSITQKKYTGSKKISMRGYEKESEHLPRFIERTGFLYRHRIDRVFSFHNLLKRKYGVSIAEKMFIDMAIDLQCIDQFTYDFRKISFLGPIRVHPRRTYLYSGELVGRIDPKGDLALQNYAALLKRGKKEDKKKVNFINEALYQLRFIKEFEIRRVEGRYYEFWTVHKDSSLSANLADTGFGASQVLPVIVSLYTSPPGSTLLYEQPEIHLHPAAQAELGSVFVKAYKRDKDKSKRIVIETHSENLILRIQTEVARGVLKPEDVMIYYIKPHSSGHQVRQIPLDEKGKFQAKWPKGFFEEAYKESLELSKAREV